jgi:hypothetical protein
MPELRIRIPAELEYRLEQSRPNYLDRKAFICLLLASALDTGPKLPAYCVGAGTEGIHQTESGSQPSQAPQVAEEIAEVDSLPSVKSFFSSSPPDIDLGESVGRESERTPRKPPLKTVSVKEVVPNLLAHEDLIQDFWRVKGGSKNQRAWSLLNTELTKIQTHHGDAVVRQQLELAINGKWKGVTLANLERFTSASNSGGYTDSISRDRQVRERFLSMFNTEQEVA